MEWIEATVTTTTAGAEPVGAMLMEAGVTGYQIEDDEDMARFLADNPFQWDYVDESLTENLRGEVYVRFYVSRNPAGLERLAAVQEGLARLKGMELPFAMGSLALVRKDVDDEDWLHIWKQYYKPFKVGHRLTVRPVWEEYKSARADEVVFTINPGSVFGTGLHQTTQLCMEMLEGCAPGARSVLDLGCGTGILSIVALMLGAERALGVDLEPNAVDIAYENAALNGVGREVYRVRSGNVLTDEVLRADIAKERYDVIVANIVADVIIALAPFAAVCAAPGGLFICGGIIGERRAEVEEALKAAGFTLEKAAQRDDWHCLLARREG